MKRRLIALLLSLTMVIGLLPPALALESGPVALTSDGEAVDEVTVCKYTTGEDQPVTVTAETDDADATFRWQFQMEDLWISIYGEEASDCVLTYAKVCNMLDENEEARMRCVVTLSDGTVYGQDGELDFTVKVDEETLPELPEPEALKPQVLSGFEVLFPEIEIPEIELPEIEIPEIELPEWPDLPELPDMPGFPEFPDYPTDFPLFPLEPSSPAEETPVTPSEETPEAPAEETPEAPAEETPEAPADETPVTPSDETPEAPAEETPAAPVEETPAAPTEETPAAPVEETPEAPAEETPAAPAEETPEAPAEETPADEAGEGGELTAAAIYNAENTNLNVVINYVFSDGEVASDSYIASLAVGTSFEQTVKNPEVLGYVATVDESLLPTDGSVTFDAKTGVTFNITSITEDMEDITVTVTYQPTLVNYTVIHYWQNVEDDKYTEHDRETLTGLTNSTVPEVAKVWIDKDGNEHFAQGAEDDYKGFYSLLYEKPAIAADGSTVVEVYYDRYYYLMNFDLDGGYGVEPIYARYGAPIGDVGTPTKAGYDFQGWLLNGVEENLPSEMPAENRTYKAHWEVEGAAKVTVVFWGENADDEEYSYIKSSSVFVAPDTEFTYSEDGTLICVLEPHTHSASCGYACGQEEHQHSIENGCYQLTCTQTSHNHVTDGCVLKCTHTHTVDCYTTGDYNYYSLVEVSKPSQSLTDTGNGIYTYTTGSGRNQKTHYYLNIGDTWYCAESGYWGGGDTTKITFNCTHTHTDECYTCGKTQGTHVHSVEAGCYELICDKTEHTHSDACGYKCGKIKHQHTSDCYTYGAGLDSNLWTFVKSDTVTVAADGSSVVNVYYDRTTFTLTFRDDGETVATITEKWGADISGKFNEAPFNTTYNGRAWECTESSKYSYALQTLDRMPKFNATFDLYNKSSNTLKTIYYYVENVGANVSENTWPSNTTNFTLLKQVDTYFNYATYNEEYHEIEGFTRYSAKVAGFSNSQKDFSNNKLYLYYLRNDYTLVFNNGYENVKSETVQYQAPLSAYNTYVPELPDAYEPGSRTFGGWYLSPDCTGDKYVLDEHTMPLGNLILYAKWVPVSHTVEFYLDKDALTAGTKLSTHPDITVPHGSKADPTPAAPENGSYTFVGWFYMDGDTEKAFDFANMPVNKDLKVYGKWSSNVLKPYTISYKIQGTDTEIADPTTGSGLAGNSKTFEAKGGEELYDRYQEGYFPVTKSHSMNFDIDGENTFTFWYVQKDAVPYIVRYVDEAGNELDGVPQKVVADNHKAVVTETFVTVSGMMPDAYQKRLVVTGSEELAQGQDWITVTVNDEEVKVHPDNVITFVYKKDDKHAYYKISHYTENLDGATWTEYGNGTSAPGTIGETIKGTPISISGFTYDHAETVVNGVVTSQTDSAELTADGLEIKLYYTRNPYPYQVRYLEAGTNNVLHDPTDGTGKYGALITENAIDIANYDKVAPTSKDLTIKIETETDDDGNLIATKNVIIFYYKEKNVTINYQAVGPDGAANFGSVSPTSETLKVLTETAKGSTPTAGTGFKFVGWYTDAACTQAVTSSWVDATTNKLTPAKVDGKNVAATYYAKFEYDVADLTIVKNVGADGQDDTFIFHITGGTGEDAIDMKVTITGSDSVTIKGLRVGTTYTVTEDTNWSWRYEEQAPKSVTIDADAKKNVAEFTNTFDNTKWLTDAFIVVNNWEKKKNSSKRRKAQGKED